MKKCHLVTIRSVMILGLVILLPSGAAFAQLPEVTTGTCNLTKMSYVTSSSAQKTTLISRDFVDLPDMLLDLDLAEGQCIKIEFSFFLSAPVPGSIEIRALFDTSPGLTVPLGIKIPPGLPLGYHIFTFIVPAETGLGSGGHNVKIQVRGERGVSVETRNRSLIVLHN